MVINAPVPGTWTTLGKCQPSIVLEDPGGNIKVTGIKTFVKYGFFSSRGEAKAHFTNLINAPVPGKWTVLW